MSICLAVKYFVNEIGIIPIFFVVTLECFVYLEMYEIGLCSLMDLVMQSKSDAKTKATTTISET